MILKFISKLFEDMKGLGENSSDGFYYKENDMPLVKGAKAKTKKGFGSNVKKSMDEGKSQAQSVAIAYSEAGEKRKKKKKAKK